MKKLLLVLIVLGLLVALNWSRVESIFKGFSEQSAEQTVLLGFYVQDIPANISPHLGLNFLDETNVEMYADNTKLGETVQYRIQGDSLVITHACGTWYMEIRGDKLYHKEFNCDFIKQ